jgi:hypothetical protein
MRLPGVRSVAPNPTNVLSVFVRRVAHMGGSFAAPAGLIGQIGGSTQTLPAGHTLVSFGRVWAIR